MAGYDRKIDAMSKTTNDYKDEDKSWRKENESYDKRLQSGTSTMYSHVRRPSSRKY